MDGLGVGMDVAILGMDVAGGRSLSGRNPVEQLDAADLDHPITLA